MKILIIYYSYEGNVDYVANAMAQEIGADLLRLKPLEEKQLKGFSKYWWGGKQVFMKKKPELEPFDHNLEEYDLIILGTPVWAFTYTPAMASFFSTVQLKGQRCALFCCHEGGKGRTLENMEKQLDGNTIIGKMDLVAPLTKKHPEALDEARAWVRDLATKIQANV